MDKLGAISMAILSITDIPKTARKRLPPSRTTLANKSRSISKTNALYKGFSGGDGCDLRGNATRQRSAMNERPLQTSVQAMPPAIVRTRSPSVAAERQASTYPGIMAPASKEPKPRCTTSQNKRERDRFIGKILMIDLRSTCYFIASSNTLPSAPVTFRFLNSALVLLVPKPIPPWGWAANSASLTSLLSM
jgi:hypothetical protein